MDYVDVLNREKVRLELIVDTEITLKKIGSRHYSYRQVREGKKVRSKYIGIADTSQIGLHKRLRLVNWLLKNQSRFLDGLRLLQELRKEL